MTRICRCGEGIIYSVSSVMNIRGGKVTILGGLYQLLPVFGAQFSVFSLKLQFLQDIAGGATHSSKSNPFSKNDNLFFTEHRKLKTEHIFFSSFIFPLI